MAKAPTAFKRAMLNKRRLDDMPTMDDIPSLHLQIVHQCGQDETRWYEHPLYQTLRSPKISPREFRLASCASDQPIIPSPDVFRSLADEPPKSAAALPTASECAVHLELLEVFYTLRKHVISTRTLDGALGIKPGTKVVYRRTLVGRKYENKKIGIKDPTFEARSRGKWPVYLVIAAMRFLIWSGKIEELMHELGGPHADARIPHLPPIDVLIVWHSFLLNPGDYQQFCDRHVLPYLRHAPFPWVQIHQAIDSSRIEFQYNLPKPAEHWFAEATGLDHDLYGFIRSIGNKPGSLVHKALKRFGGGATSLPTVSDCLSRHEAGKEPTEHAFLLLLREAERRQYEAKPLCENVVRQGAFVDKMHTHLWIRSPAFDGTLSRALDRYDNFTQLFRIKAGSTIVPTLDMDLAWHTHQLSHIQYKTAMERIAGRFIDHNDKLGTETLSLGEGLTRRVYESTFDEEYSRCLCWDCEAMLSAVMKDNGIAAMDEHWVKKTAENVREDLQYYRFVEVERRRQKLWPVMQLPLRVVGSGGCIRFRC